MIGERGVAGRTRFEEVAVRHEVGGRAVPVLIVEEPGTAETLAGDLRLDDAAVDGGAGTALGRGDVADAQTQREEHDRPEGEPEPAPGEPVSPAHGRTLRAAAPSDTSSGYRGLPIRGGWNQQGG